jgi:hypothetical protein
VIRPTALEHQRQARKRRNALRLSHTVVPLPEASMRLLEFSLAFAALGVALLLGLAH